MLEALELQQHAGQLEEQLRALKVGHPHGWWGGTKWQWGTPPPLPCPHQDCPRRKSVVLRFSLQGLKVYGADGEVGAGCRV